MKWVDVKAIPFRIKLLVTRRFNWHYTDSEGQHQLEQVKEPWNAAWAIAGIHSWSWWWVRRYGELDCGCTRNPLTRRVVLMDSMCDVHCSFMRRMREEGRGD